MKIEISEETAKFIKDLAHEIETQDNCCTDDPYFYVVQGIKEIAAPIGQTGESRWFDSGELESFTEEELKEYCDEQGYDIEEYKEQCQEYDAQEIEENVNVFFTRKGYDDHIRRNGHNYRRFKRFYPYVMHAFRNTEIENLLKAIKEIAGGVEDEST